MIKGCGSLLFAEPLFGLVVSRQCMRGASNGADGWSFDQLGDSLIAVLRAMTLDEWTTGLYKIQVGSCEVLARFSTVARDSVVRSR